MAILLSRRMQHGSLPNIIYSPRLQRISSYLTRVLVTEGYLYVELCCWGETQPHQGELSARCKVVMKQWRPRELLSKGMHRFILSSSFRAKFHHYRSQISAVSEPGSICSASQLLWLMHCGDNWSDFYSDLS